MGETILAKNTTYKYIVYSGLPSSYPISYAYVCLFKQYTSVNTCGMH